MVEAVEMVRDGTAPRIVQDESKATYEGWCRAENVVIDWSKTVQEIYNMVRGGDPSPGSGTTFDGKAVQFFKAGRLDGDTAKQAGEVTEITEEGFTVAAKGGAITVGRVQPEGARKIMAPEWIESVGLKVGDKFGE